MSSIDSLFEQLRQRGEKAFMPFIAAGDPDLSWTGDVLQLLAECGANICELGIPYSDPIADGPVIQASYTRALENGTTLDGILEMLDEQSPNLAMPIVSMVSYSIIYRRGMLRYIDDAMAAGVAGAIVPDMPVEESKALLSTCRKKDFSLIQLITPTTPRDRALRIAERSTGFIYYVSVTGITGERKELPTRLIDDVGWLREQTDLPICVGFGISQPEHVRQIAPVADGLIVGSAIVRRLAQATENNREDILQEVGKYVSMLVEALRNVAAK